MGAEIRIGSTLAGYRIDSIIGRGGMSVVYRAEHLGLGRNVALKILAPELYKEKGFRERFIRESRLAASIDHPNIIPIYEAGEIADLLYIAMRYVEGTDLKAYLGDFGPLEPRQAISIISQVASALDTAHARGLVHRDVKPGNILIVSGIGVDASDHAYLADFGLTKQALSVSGMTATGQFVGTIDYCAPEQIKGEAVDGRADVYSLGGVLYECLTGVPPYKADSEVAVLWAHIQGKPPSATARRPELPAGIDHVIAKAMAKSPGDRYAKCGQLAVEARTELAVATAEHPIPVTTRVRRRQRRLALAAAATGILALAAVVIFLLSRGHPAVFPKGPNTVAVIDPATNRIVNGVKVGRAPQGIAADRGVVWVADFDDKDVSRVNPNTNTEENHFSAGGSPTGIAAGEGFVWVTNGFEDTVSVIDPRLNNVTDTTQLGGPIGVAVGSGAVWITSMSNNAVYRLDPETKGTTDTIALAQRGEDPAPEGIAVGLDGVWVANSIAETVARIDPDTKKVVARAIAIGCHPDEIAVGAGFVWTTCEQEDKVEKIDTQQNSGIAEVNVGAGPLGMAATDDAVWVACSRAGQVWRIEPKSGTVVARIDVGGSPQGIAVVNGRIWVTVSEQ